MRDEHSAPGMNPNCSTAVLSSRVLRYLNGRTLLAISANYKVLFLQGGAIGENAIVPMNLVGGKKGADYVVTGEWSKKSIKEAGKYCVTRVAASSEDRQFTYVPAQSAWNLDPAAA